MLSKFMLMMIFFSNVISITLTVMICQFVTKNMVYDMDLVRNQYLEDSKYYYMRGCLDGIDYPDEWRQSTVGYNERSPTMYCGGLKYDNEDLFMSSMYKLGRKKP